MEMNNQFVKPINGLSMEDTARALEESRELFRNLRNSNAFGELDEYGEESDMVREIAPDVLNAIDKEYKGCAMDDTYNKTVLQGACAYGDIFCDEKQVSKEGISFSGMSPEELNDLKNTVINKERAELASEDGQPDFQISNDEKKTAQAVVENASWEGEKISENNVNAYYDNLRTKSAIANICGEDNAHKLYQNQMYMTEQMATTEGWNLESSVNLMNRDRSISGLVGNGDFMKEVGRVTCNPTVDMNGQIFQDAQKDIEASATHFDNEMEMNMAYDDHLSKLNYIKTFDGELPSSLYGNEKYEAEMYESSSLAVLERKAQENDVYLGNNIGVYKHMKEDFQYDPFENDMSKEKVESASLNPAQEKESYSKFDGTTINPNVDTNGSILKNAKEELKDFDFSDSKAVNEKYNSQLDNLVEFNASGDNAKETDAYAHLTVLEKESKDHGVVLKNNIHSYDKMKEMYSDPFAEPESSIESIDLEAEDELDILAKDSSNETLKEVDAISSAARPADKEKSMMQESKYDFHVPDVEGFSDKKEKEVSNKVDPEKVRKTVEEKFGDLTKGLANMKNSFDMDFGS